MQLYGEYLHAFQDTFAHRDQKNAPIGVNLGFGHTAYGAQTDYTYDAFVSKPDLGLGVVPLPLSMGTWFVREERTLQMEREVFENFKRDFNTSGLNVKGQNLTFDYIKPILEAFNDTKESDGDGYEKDKPGDSKKIEILKSLIDSWNVDANIYDVDEGYGYNKTVAEANRKKLLCKDNKPIDQDLVPGVILPDNCS